MFQVYRKAQLVSITKQSTISPLDKLEQGYLQVAFLCLSSRLRRSLREIVEVVAGFQPATTSTISLNAGPLVGWHEQKDNL